MDANAPAGRLTGQASFPTDSPWFKGHFPGDPLLPGIAQLHLVLETIRAALGENVCLTGLKRVRFKRIIRPEETMAVAADPVDDKPGMYRFQLTVAGENACSGLMLTGPADAGKPTP
jgi:3-hydroxymyristoyl/3-hydroxydecanoyl-(acyl carrier protein) dehydratase